MDVPRHWRSQAARYALEGARCVACGEAIFPPREVCCSCRSTDLVPHKFAGRGTLYSFSTVFVAPDGFQDQVPYMVALVRLEEGPLVAAQLTDISAEDAVIDMPVEMVTRRLRQDGPQGIVVYGYKFRPLLLEAPDEAEPSVSAPVEA